MRFNSLQFGKAISAALFVLLLVVVGSKNALAQNQMATLQHNDSITGVFYGQNAYSEAYNAAVDSDIITLSSGTFNAVHINKSITIRGAGCVFDPLSNVLPTIIPGNFQLGNNNITFEGIWFTGLVSLGRVNEPHNYNSFVKCNLNAVNNGTNSNGGTDQGFSRFENCIINNYSSRKFYGTSIINCVVRFTDYFHIDIYNPTIIYNSVIVFDNNLSINNLVVYNSIMATVSGHEVSNCTFFNCIGVETGETSLFDGQITQNVMEVDSYEEVFETFAGAVFYENSYQLKEEIATGFLGQDGTEVGIYGGMMPYDPRPSYMRMKRCNVAPRSTIDNKLSVEIEVLTDDE